MEAIPASDDEEKDDGVLWLWCKSVAVPGVLDDLHPDVQMPSLRSLAVARRLPKGIN